MKYTVTIFAALAAVASAQSVCEASAEKVPACALGYLASAASSIGGCGLVDFNCQCSYSSQVQGAVQNSVISACSDLGAVLNGANSLCACARSNPGQTISLNSIQSMCQPSAAAIPPCGLGYVAEAANTIGGCALYDFACQCSNVGAVMSSVSGSVSSACGASASNVFASAAALCACVSGGGAGTSPSGSGSASATPSASGSMSMGTGTASPSGTSPTTAKMTTTPGSVGTVTMQTQTSFSMPKFTNEAVVAVPAVGAILGGLAGLAAWL